MSLQRTTMTDRPLTKNSPGRNVSDPLVSVIIPHYNDLANLRRCLSRLASQTLPKDRFEIVVADNGSACGLEEVQNVCGRIARVVHAPIPGAGPARNVAVAASSGAVLAFTDSDCRPAPDWLENGFAALRNADIVGGRVDVDVGDPAHPTAIEAFELVFAFNVKRYIEELGFSVSANIFVSRATFDRVERVSRPRGGGPRLGDESFRRQLSMAVRPRRRRLSSRAPHVGGTLEEVAATHRRRFRVGQ